MMQPWRRARRFAALQWAMHRPRLSRRHVYNAFHTDVILKTNNFDDVTWLGNPVWQNVLDLWALQEAIAAIKPAVLLETGTNRGGSALFYASLFELMGKGRVLTVDIEKLHSHEHPRIDFLIGSSVGDDVLAKMREAAETADGPVMVVLDSDHSAAHVLAEMRAYGPLVTSGSMMLVQDGLIDTLLLYEGYRPGPLDAIETYLAETSDFEVDTRYDRRFLISHHPSGFLRRR